MYCPNDTILLRKPRFQTKKMTDEQGLLETHFLLTNTQFESSFNV